MLYVMQPFFNLRLFFNDRLPDLHALGAVERRRRFILAQYAGPRRKIAALDVQHVEMRARIQFQQASGECLRKRGLARPPHPQDKPVVPEPHPYLSLECW